MCARFTLAARPELLARQLPWVVGEPGPARYNLAPTDPISVVVAGPDQARLTTARWGFVPPWAESLKAVGGRYINARLEGAAASRLFGRAWVRGRCLVLSSGFYEWLREGKRRRPFLFAPAASEQVWTMAGLCSRYRQGDESVLTCTILTRPAYGPIGRIHDRMPLLLPDELGRRWLYEEPDEAELEAARVPIHGFEVSPRVNRVGIDDPGCIEPLTPGSEGPQSA